MLKYDHVFQRVLLKAMQHFATNFGVGNLFLMSSLIWFMFPCPATHPINRPGYYDSHESVHTSVPSTPSSSWARTSQSGCSPLVPPPQSGHTETTINKHRNNNQQTQKQQSTITETTINNPHTELVWPSIRCYILNAAVYGHAFIYI